MNGFKAFIVEQQSIEERFARKSAVSAFAVQGRNHGNNAIRSYNKAKQTLRSVTNAESTDKKVDALTRAFIDLLDGLVSQRRQIGSVSSQITASSVL